MVQDDTSHVVIIIRCGRGDMRMRVGEGSRKRLDIESRRSCSCSEILGVAVGAEMGELVGQGDIP